MVCCVALIVGRAFALPAARAAKASTNATAGAAAVSPAWLQFRDGSCLHGRLLAVLSDQRIQWECPAARQPIDFRTTDFAWIGFEHAQAAATLGEGTCRFRFVNGDVLFGRLAGVDANSVELKPWFGGALKAARRAVQSIAFLPKDFAIAYEGPTGFAGWHLGRESGAWHYRNGTFTATAPGTLGRDFKLAGSCSLRFDLTWNGQFDLIVVLYTDALDRLDYGLSSYAFYLGPGYVNLQRIQRGMGALQLGQAQFPALRESNAARFEFRALRPEAALELWVDGQRVQRWEDQRGFVGEGSGIVFFQQVDGTSLQLRNLRVCTWTGRGDLAEPAQAPTNQDVLYLVNRDKVTGTVRGFQDGKLSVFAAQTALNIPLGRVTRIVFGNTLTNTTPPSSRDVRAYFAGGGGLALRLERWTDQSVSGESPTFGPVSFSPQPVRQLEFNLNQSAAPGQERLPDPGGAGAGNH